MFAHRVLIGVFSHLTSPSNLLYMTIAGPNVLLHYYHPSDSLAGRSPNE